MMLTPVTAVPYFDEAGGGDTTVLMLHGIGGGRQAFAHQMKPLADAGFHAVAWDMPGYGHSSTVDPYTFETLAEECIELIDVLDSERLVLVGHSLGGMVAQEVAARAPGRIAALVLAGTSPAFGKADGEWQRRFVAERTAPLDAGRSMAELATQLVAQMVSADASDAARAEAVAVMSLVPPLSYRSALQALMGFDRRAALPSFAMPVLLIAGSDDRNAPPSILQGMAERIPQSDYVCLERCGHLLPLEQPAAFNEALLGFLRRVTAPS
jgi:pimeloyl-ACP methyl ester carboxylesterase